MPKQPLLSVIMPVHDGERWIAATLDSLVSEADEDVEIILIDSSPTTATAGIVDRYKDRLPIRVERRPDLSPWQTKTNLGMRLATADLCCILHQDDLWLAGRVSAVRRWQESGPECVLHLAPTLIIDGAGRRLGRWRCPLPPDRILATELLLERLLVQNFVSVPAPIFRRDAWLSCGGMDEELWYTPDWDVWLKLAVEGPVTYHDDVTTAFRVHRNSLTVAGSRDADQFRSQMQRVLDRHIDRAAPSRRHAILRAASASINVNVSLAAASAGSFKEGLRAAANVLSLGPAGMRRYFRDSRLVERVLPRLRSRLRGAF